MNHENVFVSVIIPTYNDLIRLKDCIKALGQQSFPRNQYEIIVVDNNSTDGTSLWLSQQASIIFAHEAKQTSYAARNAGIRIAKGDVLAFTDSDCIPAEDWLEKGVAHLLSIPNCGFVGGSIKLFFQDPGQLTPVEIYEAVTALPQQDYVDEHRFAATANMFTFKSVIDKVGMFDSDLSSRGDYEWGRRVYADGYCVFYAEDAQVLHPSRHSFKQMKHKSSRVLRGTYELREKNEELSYYVLLKDLLIGIRPPIKRIFKLTSDSEISKIKDKLSLAYVILLLHYNKSLVTASFIFKRILRQRSP